MQLHWDLHQDSHLKLAANNLLSGYFEVSEQSDPKKKLGEQCVMDAALLHLTQS